MWSKIKTYLKKVKARTIDALIDAVGEGFELVNLEDIAGWYKDCGYTVPLQ